MVWKNEVSKTATMGLPGICSRQASMPMSAALLCRGAELCQFVDLGDDIVIDEHGAIEVLAALHYAVPHGVDVVQRVDGLVVGPLVSASNTRAMAALVIGHGRVDDHLILVDAVLVEGLGGTDTLADALGEHFMGFNIDELVLQRGSNRR